MGKKYDERNKVNYLDGTSWIRNAINYWEVQIRVSMKNIPKEIELYRLTYKKEEYENLYKRRNVKYETGDLCPYYKNVRKGEIIKVHESYNEDLNSDLLDNRLQGIDVNTPGKRYLCICSLLGCKQCQDYFKVEVVDR